MKVALYDYGAGNLHSLGKALERGGAEVTVTADWDEALTARALVLPGVGSFGAAVQALEGHQERVREALEAGMPCLGICLGMQLFFETSEEGSGRGIGILPGRVRRLASRRVPQMGWNDVETAADPLFRGTSPLVAYYANSYVCEPEDPESAVAWSEYDGERFLAGVRRGRSWGVQFHPEKSSTAGVRIVHNFLELARAFVAPDEAGRTAPPGADEGETELETRKDDRGKRKKREKEPPPDEEGRPW